MKRPLFPLSFGFLIASLVGWSASAAYAQSEATKTEKTPKILIGYQETREQKNIGGQVMQSTSLKFTDLKALGTWVSREGAGQRGYVYVDAAQEAKWRDKDLIVSLGKGPLKVARLQSWTTGETALVIDNIDDETAALLRQSDFRKPLESQFRLKWQLLEGAKVRLTITPRGDGTLQLAPDNARFQLTLTRHGQPVDLRPIEQSERAGKEPNFETLRAGAVWQRDFLLNRYANIEQPGIYLAEVSYQLPARNNATPAASVSATPTFAESFKFNGQGK